MFHTRLWLRPNPVNLGLATDVSWLIDSADQIPNVTMVTVIVVVAMLLVFVSVLAGLRTGCVIVVALGC